MKRKWILFVGSCNDALSTDICRWMSDMNDELGITWKETFATYFNVLN
jgi:hypothetical protein